MKKYLLSVPIIITLLFTSFFLFGHAIADGTTIRVQFKGEVDAKEIDKVYFLYKDPNGQDQVNELLLSLDNSPNANSLSYSALRPIEDSDAQSIKVVFINSTIVNYPAKSNGHSDNGGSEIYVIKNDVDMPTIPVEPPPVTEEEEKEVGNEEEPPPVTEEEEKEPGNEEEPPPVTEEEKQEPGNEEEPPPVTEEEKQEPGNEEEPPPVTEEEKQEPGNEEESPPVTEEEKQEPGNEEEPPPVTEEESPTNESDIDTESTVTPSSQEILDKDVYQVTKTIDGGELPDTAGPWMNWLLWSGLLLVGSMVTLVRFKRI